MKYSLLCMTLILVSPSVIAQTADSIRFVQGIPMVGEDSAQAAPQGDQVPYDKLRSLRPENLPAAVQKELNENEMFSGWRSDARVEYDKNTELYWVHFSDSGKVRSYAFNSQGAPVSIREKNDTVNVKQK
jgi:hypothetical protein